jgi:purine-binding chemotaxis protein CheW
MNLIIFTAHDKEYAVDILQVCEVIRIRCATPIPDAPDFVEGVINLRGNVVSIISLRKKLGFEKKELDRSNRIIVAKVDDNMLGVVVDNVIDVLTVEPGNIKLPDEVLKKARYLTGVARIKESLVPIIDISRLLSYEDKTIIAEVHNKVEIVRKT